MFNLEAHAHRGYHVPWTELPVHVTRQHWEHSVWPCALRMGKSFEDHTAMVFAFSFISVLMYLDLSCFLECL